MEIELTKKQAYQQLSADIILPKMNSKACTMESLLLMRDFQQYFAVSPKLANKLSLPKGISINTQVLHYILEAVCWYQYTKVLPFKACADRQYYYMMLNLNHFRLFQHLFSRTETIDKEKPVQRHGMVVLNINKRERTGFNRRRGFELKKYLEQVELNIASYDGKIKPQTDYASNIQKHIKTLNKHLRKCKALQRCVQKRTKLIRKQKVKQSTHKIRLQLEMVVNKLQNDEEIKASYNLIDNDIKTKNGHLQATKTKLKINSFYEYKKTMQNMQDNVYEDILREAAVDKNLQKYAENIQKFRQNYQKENKIEYGVAMYSLFKANPANIDYPNISVLNEEEEKFKTTKKEIWTDLLVHQSQKDGERGFAQVIVDNFEYPEFKSISNDIIGEYFKNFVPQLDDVEYLSERLGNVSVAGIIKALEINFQLQREQITGNSPVEVLFIETHEYLQRHIFEAINKIGFTSEQRKSVLIDYFPRNSSDLFLFTKKLINHIMTEKKITNKQISSFFETDVKVYANILMYCLDNFTQENPDPNFLMDIVLDIQKCNQWIEFQTTRKVPGFMLCNRRFNSNVAREFNTANNHQRECYLMMKSHLQMQYKISTKSFCRFFAIGFSKHLERNVKLNQITDMYNRYSQTLTFGTQELTVPNIRNFLNPYIDKHFKPDNTITQSLNFMEIFSAYENKYVNLFEEHLYTINYGTFEYNTLWGWNLVQLNKLLLI